MLSFVLACALSAGGDLAPQGDLVEATRASLVTVAQQPAPRALDDLDEVQADDDEPAAPATPGSACAPGFAVRAPSEPCNQSDRPAPVRRRPPRAAGALHP